MSLFVPAVRPAGPATASRWIFGFAAGELLLPDTEPATLTPLAAAADDRLWPDADQPPSSAPTTSANSTATTAGP
jgi:hypothetical protein